MKPKANNARSSSLKTLAKQRLEFAHQVPRRPMTPARRVGNFHSTSEDSRLKKSSSIRGILSFDGHKSSGSTRKALARQSSSKSETQRTWVSILASVSRLKSQPQRRQRAANIGCVSFCWSRRRRICGPTKLRKFFMFRFQNRNASGCKTLVVRNTERFDLPPNAGFEKFGARNLRASFFGICDFKTASVSKIEGIIWKIIQRHG